MIGRTLAEILGGDDYLRSKPWIARALAGETVSFEKEFPDAVRSRHVQINYIPLRLGDGSIAGFIAVAQDITLHREENLRLSLLNQRDPLTGLLNRTGFNEYLMKKTFEGTAAAVAILYIDLDRFKPINDRHGHAAGDEVLREFAVRLLCLVRPTDAVARLGGDEFAIALADPRDIGEAVQLADRVVEVARQPIPFGEFALNIGASVGVAMNAGLYGGLKELVAKADAMAYEAKAAGRGRRAVAESIGTNESRYG